MTRTVIEKAKAYSAADAFDGLYRLESLKRVSERIMASVDALMVPTAPYAPKVADLKTDPIVPNIRLGTYTNFVNLLDYCAVAVPPGKRSIFS